MAPLCRCWQMSLLDFAANLGGGGPCRGCSIHSYGLSCPGSQTSSGRHSQLHWHTGRWGKRPCLWEQPSSVGGGAGGMSILGALLLRSSSVLSRLSECVQVLRAPAPLLHSANHLPRVPPTGFPQSLPTPWFYFPVSHQIHSLTSFQICSFGESLKKDSNFRVVARTQWAIYVAGAVSGMSWAPNNHICH